MVYRITVDGKKKYVKAPIREYSLEADNLAREKIIKHYLDEENAVGVIIDSALNDKDKETVEYWPIE